MRPPWADLPITAVLDDVCRAVADPGLLVLKAPPGAGKTTGVPLALRQAGVGRMLLAQPRRMAARAAADRLASLCGTIVGDEIGYQVRFDRRWGDATSIVAMTTGVLLRRLQTDPFLQTFDAVLLDEFHERSLEVDLALGMLHRLRQTVRPDLKLIVMSATLDPQPIAALLRSAGAASGVPVVESEGRAYPVDVRYAKQPSSDPLQQQIARLLPTAMSATAGDVLVFLPGVGEIRRAEREIAARRAAGDAEVMALYGDMTPDAQDRVLRPSEAVRRKVVLATNVAETSVTLPSVTAVIDSGLARVMRYDASRGLPRLEVEPISQASAQQRAGRAGRTGPGVCWRLWPQAMHRARRESDTPEVLRSDLSGAVLQLAGWGERDVLGFPWLDPPHAEAVQRGESLLHQLGALDTRGITALGREMLSLPVHPRLARLLVEGQRLGVAGAASVIAALLSERDPFRATGRKTSTAYRRDPRKRSAAPTSCGRSDVVDRWARLERFAQGEEDEGVNAVAARHVYHVAERLAASLPGGVGPQRLDGQAAELAIMRALLAAYPDRLAKRRVRGSDRGLMVGGRGVRLASESQLREGELFVCVDVQDSGSDAKVRMASAVQPEWLDSAHMRQVTECFFHPTLQQVAARRRTYWGDLLLTETPTGEIDPDQAAALLHQQALAQWSRIFPAEDPKVVGLLARIRNLAKWMPELELPDVDQQRLQELLPQLCHGRRSFDALRSAPWAETIEGLLAYPQRQQLERHAPQRMQVPSGNVVAIQYEEDKPPQMAVRLQELFGWTESPRIAGGRVPLVLNLLGPNHRGQQITADLASFWQNTYPQVRKDLRRRYPKHHWPEDPLQATATRSGLGRDAEQ